MSKAKRIADPDVLVIGAGPAGSTFAHILAGQKHKVLMLDAGAQLSPRAGRTIKNSFAYQRDLNQFTYIIQGLLHPLSVPPGGGLAEMDPITWRPKESVYDPNKYSDRGAINPDQNPDKNLDSESVAFGVGGMMQHWTAATPRHHPTMERYKFQGLNDTALDALWNDLYTEAEKLLGTNQKAFDNSVRNTIVREALEAHYAGKLPPGYGAQNLPMAVTRSDDPKKAEFAIYTGTDRILGALLDPPGDQFLEILPETRAEKLVLKGDTVDHAEVVDLMEGETYQIRAKQYVVAAGAVMSASLLWNSLYEGDLKPDALGKYIIEHPIAFTQIVLRQELIDKIATDPRFEQKRQTARARYARATAATGLKAPRTPPAPGVPAEDPLPIPQDDPAPNVWIPVSDSRPWHCQIHKDAFHYGALPPGIDDRLIVDLRWFCILNPRAENRVTFSRDRFTAFGTPQPTFEFALVDGERFRMHRMMQDMLSAASALGGFLPGMEPKFMPKGLALHIQGTCRMGTDPAESVVDEYLKVHGVTNLYVGGNGVIPTANGSNPTLTTVALALRSARQVLTKLSS
jgi:pyranose oxidase